LDKTWHEKQYKKLGFKAQRMYPNEELLRFIGSSFFNIDKNKRKKIKILELGCGSGANLWMIAKENFDAYGIDNSKTSLKLCSKMLNKWECNAKIKLADMLELPYPDRFFDAVFDVLSIIHIPFSKHRILYSEVKRVLKPKGVFFSYQFGEKSFSFKHGWGKKVEKFTIDRINNPNAPYAGNRYLCFPSEKAVHSLLNKAGFQSVSIENVQKTYQNRKVEMQYLSIKATSSV